MGDVPRRSVEVTAAQARRLQRRGLPEGVEVHERDEVDYYGRTYARTSSGLYVRGEEYTVEDEIRELYGEQHGTDPVGAAWDELERDRDPTTVCDLFCGCGGFSLGMLMAGLDVVVGLGNSVDAVTTYLLNLARPDVEMVFTDTGAEGDWRRLGRDDPVESWAGTGARAARDWERGVRGFVFGDATKVTGDQLLEAAGVESVDVVVGGPPCQCLSTANAKRCLEDPRNGLLWEYMRLVTELEPSVFLMENVPGLLTTADGALFEALAKIATDHGYRVRATVMDAVHHGVPQYRRRAFVAGTHTSCDRTYQFPTPTHFAAGRDPDGSGWPSGHSAKWYNGGPEIGPLEDRPEIDVTYDRETGRWSFDVEGDSEEADPQEELFA